MTAWKSGMLLTAARLLDDTPTKTTSGYTAATGFSLNSFSGYRVGNMVVLDIYLNRTGATITATSGNITDTQCGTAPSGWRPTSGTINGTWDTGVAEGGFVMGTDGITTLRTANGDISNNSNVRLHLEFIVD
ncbi:hypothetical protein [Streptomyces sp. KR55]|uniref:hypothetical protein n=1 Tax=Streptomyces sp. KR55 TaxID=3457425 RepID=UPI003FD2ADAC